MPWNDGLSSLWNRAKLYKPPTPWWFEPCDICFICHGLARGTGSLCGGCGADLPRRAQPRLRRKIDSVDAALAPFRYEFPISECIKSAKFHADLGALSVLTTGFTASFLLELEEIDVLIPVPLLPWRFLRRGFNQAGELALALSRVTQYPLRRDLVCRRQSWGQPQSLLSAVARRENMKSAFKVRGNVAGLRIAIVDDIITTGATCSALADVLRAAGAVRVIAIAAAATSLRRDDSAAYGTLAG